MSLGYDDEGRLGRDAPIVEHNTVTVPAASDRTANAPLTFDDEPPGFAAWYAVFQAECVVGYELRRIETLATWPSEVLRDISWVATDAGCSAAYAELARRGDL